MDSTRTRAHTCLCGELLDVASGQDGKVPRPGALTLCAYCGQLYVFAPDMSYIPTTLDDVHLNPEQRAQVADAQERLRAGEIRAVAEAARIRRG